MAKNNGGEKGKLVFVRQMLEQDRNANEKTVNAAWEAAGHSGTISRSSVGKVRAEMGLTNKRRPRKAKAEAETSRRSPRQVTRRGRVARTAAAPVSKTTRGRRAAAAPDTVPASSAGADDRGRVIQGLEGDLDRILFRVMSLDGLTEVEDLLRRSRRLLILGS